MKLFLIIAIIALASTHSKAQIELARMQKQYEKRFDFLDSMHGIPSNYGLSFKEIEVTVSDSISISAWFIPKENSKYTLLMVHGFMMNKSLMLSRAKFFADMGMSVLLIDLRARGLSTGNKTGGMGEGNVPDVTAVAQYYSSNYVSFGKLIGYGFSHGGRALIHTAAASNDLTKLILESTPYSLADGLKRQLNLPQRPDIREEDLDAVLATIPKLPILLMIGDNDTAINSKEGEKLMRHTKNKKSKMVIFADTQHDVVLDKSAGQIEKVIKRFLKMK